MARQKKSMFDAESIQRLFGHEAAEDEDPARLREYYFKSATYDQVVTNLPIRLLVGHKGIGKSAMFRVAIAESRDKKELVVDLKPDDILDVLTNETDFIRSVRNWKTSLVEIIRRECCQLLGLPVDTAFEGRVVSTSLAKAVEAQSDRSELAARFLANGTVTVFLDDLDRGWQGSKADVRRISSLLNAVRDLSNEDRGLRFRISLRSDVYFLVRTSDESTDKIEGSVVWNSWSNHEIFALLVKRIETYFGREIEYDTLENYKPGELAKYLDPIFVPRFQGRGHWRNAPIHRVLMSLIRRRPRDLVKLCSLAGNHAFHKHHQKIETSDFEEIFEEYSQGRIQDTINEYSTELRDIERLLFGMAPTVREKSARAGYVYRNDELFHKIKNIEQRGQFLFHSGRVATSQELAAFLYKINFITGRKESGGLIVRNYFEEQRYLQSAFVDFGFDWEVHPAYRWALQPGDIDSIFDNLRLTQE